MYNEMKYSIIPSTSSACYMDYMMLFTKLLKVNIYFN